MLRLPLVAIFFTALLCGVVHAQQRYTIAVLPLDLALGDSVRVINNRGQVLGSNHVWQSGTVTLLETPPAGASYSHCLADNGDVCGFFYQDYEEHAFYSTGGTAVDLGGFLWRRRNARAAINSIASSVNDHGQVVGYSRTDEGEHAFLWQKGILSDLGTLGGTTSSAYSINDAGQIVGMAYSDDRHIHAFLWQNGQMSDLGGLPGNDYNVALAINERGDVLGKSGNHCVLWQGSAIVDLGMDLQASNLNNVGQVVGTAGNKEGETPYAALWQDGKLQKLANLIPIGTTWKLEQAASINDAGQIVGVGRVGGRFHAFLLTPIVLP